MKCSSPSETLSTLPTGDNTFRSRAASGVGQRGFFGGAFFRSGQPTLATAGFATPLTADRRAFTHSQAGTPFARGGGHEDPNPDWHRWHPDPHSGCRNDPLGAAALPFPHTSAKPASGAKSRAKARGPCKAGGRRTRRAAGRAPYRCAPAPRTEARSGRTATTQARTVFRLARARPRLQRACRHCPPPAACPAVVPGERSGALSEQAVEAARCHSSGRLRWGCSPPPPPCRLERLGVAAAAARVHCLGALVHASGPGRKRPACRLASGAGFALASDPWIRRTGSSLARPSLLPSPVVARRRLRPTRHPPRPVSVRRRQTAQRRRLRPTTTAWSRRRRMCR